MDIMYCKYILTPINAPNAFSDFRPKEGVLLKIDEKYFLDYFPWIEFGDESVDVFLKQIKEKGLPDFLLALLLLEKDKKISNTPFLNHGLNDLKSSVVKLKVDDLFSCQKIIEQNLDKVFRLDFNNLYDFNQTSAFWQGLSLQAQARIEYIEDPCSIEFWGFLRGMNVPVASDRLKAPSEFKIYKPNIELVKKNTKQMIFSSYMGHDLGRFHCYLSLIHSGNLSLFHGIDTPNLYKEQKKIFTSEGNYRYLNQKAIAELYEELKGYEWKWI